LKAQQTERRNARLVNKVIRRNPDIPIPLVRNVRVVAHPIFPKEYFVEFTVLDNVVAYDARTGRVVSTRRLPG
jgi:hypothetical protein